MKKQFYAENEHREGKNIRLGAIIECDRYTDKALADGHWILSNSQIQRLKSKKTDHICVKIDVEIMYYINYMLTWRNT